MKISYKRILSFAMALALVLSLVPALENHAHAVTVTGLDTSFAAKGLTFTYTDATKGGAASWTASGTTGIEASVKNDTTYKSGWFNYYNEASTTLTITYSGSEEMTLSFDYSATIGSAGGEVRGSVNVNGTSYTTAGTHDGSVETKLSPSNKTVTITIATTACNKMYGQPTTTINITNLAFVGETVNTNPNVTFKVAENGSYTVDGTAISADTVQNKSKDESYSLVATPAAGYQFFGWYSTFGGYFSYASTATYSTDTECEVYPVFVSATSPIFGVGTATSATYKDVDNILGEVFATTATYYNVSVSKYFVDLNDAVAYAQSSGNSYIVLTSSGTLPAGTYTIPSGITLLIPFDSANTLYTTTPCSTGTYATPTAYRTLTMESGANLVINGALSVSGKHMRTAAGQMNGSAPTGPQGWINMLDGSNITVNNGGALYAYGYITGAGAVAAQSGATVYELFQIGDFRGGTQTTTEMLDNDQKVFFFSQYYVQNIEVPLTLHAGATEYSFTTIYMNSAAIASSVAFIGSSGCMFTMTDGYVVKQYDGSKDRLVLDSYSNVSLSPITMDMAGKEIDTSAYVLPINGNISVNAHSGNISIAQDMALLPGAEINIGTGATATINSGVSVYVYDASSWSTYCWGNISGTQQNVTFVPVKYAPSKTYTRTAADLVDAKIHVAGTLDATAGYLYTTGDGAAITGEAGAVVKMNAVADSVTYQILMNLADTSAYTDTNLYVVKSSDSDVYVKIPAVSAKLQHGDGNYLATAGAAAGTVYNYCATCDCWYTGQHVFQITWNVNDTISTSDVHAGNTVFYPGTTPTKAADGAGHYTFSGWATTEGGTALASIPAAAADVTYYAVFASAAHTDTTTKDHKCDTCGYATSTCPVDADKDHVCDICEHTTSHTDTNFDHICEYCKKTFSECKDEDSDCICDYENCKKQLAHIPNADDGDCTTDITCSICGTVTTEGNAAHTPNADDGDCTTDITCSICGTVTTEGNAAHTPNADDGDCTTDITCSICGTVTTEGNAAHTSSYVDNGDGTHDYVCTCGTVEIDNEEHTYTDGTCACGAEEPVATGLKGDVTLDGVVDMDDAVALMQHVLKAELITDATALANGEVTNDTELDMDDAVKLMQYVLKAIDSLD